jgi:hypothetical protein
LTASSIPATFSGTFSGNILSLTVSHNAYGQLRAGSITTMSVTGNYGDGVGGDTTLKLTQAFGGAKAALGALSVGGWMNDVNIVSTDSLGAITAGGMIGSNIYAGALSVDEVLPPILAINDTMVTPASIASVTVRGITGAAASFVNTNLVSWNIGTLKLNKIQVGNGGTPFGVAANSIKSYSAQIGAKLYTWMPTVSAWPDDTSASNGDYEVFKAI